MCSTLRWVFCCTMSGGGEAYYTARNRRFRAVHVGQLVVVEQIPFSFLWLLSFLFAPTISRAAGLRPIRATCPPIVRASCLRAGRAGITGTALRAIRIMHDVQALFSARSPSDRPQKKYPLWGSFSMKKIPPMHQYLVVCWIYFLNLETFLSLFCQIIFIFCRPSAFHFHQIWQNYGHFGLIFSHFCLKSHIFGTFFSDFRDFLSIHRLSFFHQISHFWP